MRPRDVLSWKFLFYHVLLPVLRSLGPARCDAVLSGYLGAADIGPGGSLRILPGSHANAIPGG